MTTMKRIFIICFSAIIASSIGCKKYSQDYGYPDSPPQEKKWVVTTIAGDGLPAFADGPASQAHFRAPEDVAVTPDGSIYVADALNHRIRKIAGGQVTTFAGYGVEDTSSGIGTAAGFAIPIQVVSDADGTLYTLDVNDFRVRKINPDALVTVAAGNGIRGFADGNADRAEFGESFGMVPDNLGNIYISDWENKRIRKISNDGQVTTIFGPAQFGPGGIAIDKQENLYVVDQSSFQIRKINPDGTLIVFAGAGTPGDKDGNATAAQFSSNMRDVVIDNEGNLYLSDENRIRKITPGGQVSTIAGSSYGYRDGNGDVAKFAAPNGLAIDGQGNLYVADNFNNRIRKISFQ